MNRFTDTGKWSDPWFQDLPPVQKLFWLYVCDVCDRAGVWAVNLKLAEFQIGMPVSVTDIIAHFQGRIIEIKAEKWWLPKFIRYQYGTLSMQCAPHRSIIMLLDRHGIPLSEIEQAKIPAKLG